MCTGAIIVLWIDNYLYWGNNCPLDRQLFVLGQQLSSGSSAGRRWLSPGGPAAAERRVVGRSSAGRRWLNPGGPAAPAEPRVVGGSSAGRRWLAPVVRRRLNPGSSAGRRRLDPGGPAAAEPRVVGRSSAGRRKVVILQTHNIDTDCEAVTLYFAIGGADDDDDGILPPLTICRK
jgi:hypothetical protein